MAQSVVSGNSSIYGRAPELSNANKVSMSQYGAAPVVGVAQSTYDAVDVPLDIENQYAPAPARSVVAASVANRTYDHVSDKISVASASNYSPAPVAPAGYQTTRPAKAVPTAPVATMDAYGALQLSPALAPRTATASLNVFDPRHPLMQQTGQSRMPLQSDYRGQPFFRENFTREDAIRCLQGQPVGSFVIRPSAFAGCLAITHVEDDGTLGHGVIHLRTGAEGRYGYSIENSKKTFETLPIMLSVLPGLRLSMYGASYDAPRRPPNQNNNNNMMNNNNNYSSNNLK